MAALSVEQMGERLLKAKVALESMSNDKVESKYMILFF
jgi:hypothetical protein